MSDNAPKFEPKLAERITIQAIAAGAECAQILDGKVEVRSCYCPYCGAVNVTQEAAFKHDGQCEKHPMAANCTALRQQVADLEAVNMGLRKALGGVAAIGGNLPDERLTNRTGPNDAAQRGLMYCHARKLALEALAAIPTEHRARIEAEAERLREQLAAHMRIRDIERRLEAGRREAAERRGLERAVEIAKAVATGTPGDGCPGSLFHAGVVTGAKHIEGEIRAAAAKLAESGREQADD